MSYRSEKLVAGLVAALFVAGALFASCAAPPVKSYRFWACGGVMSIDHKSHAFAAIYLALNERGWKIMQRDFVKKKVGAQACYSTDPTSCAAMNFQANDSGQILVNQMSGRPVPGNLRDDLERWMQGVHQSYGKFSCFTDDSLREAMKPFGFTF
jgi:hypothetical protein